MNEAAEKKRGAFLTVWLILMLIGNVVVASIYLLLNSIFIAAFPHVPSWTSYLYGIFALANVIFVLYLFMWKRWAFYALCVSAGIAFIMNIFVVGVLSSIPGLLGPIILYLILRPKWDLFE